MAAVGGNVRVTSDSSPSSPFTCGISLSARTSFTPPGVLRPGGGSHFIRAASGEVDLEKCYVFS